MGTGIKVNIETTDPLRRLCDSFDANVEKGIFRTLADLIKIDNIVWDPVGAFFSLSCGYNIHKYRAGGGAVYDPYGEELFLTQNHIDRLFAIATARKNRGRSR